MANLFKPTYSRVHPETGERETHRLRKWYGKFRDADGVLQRVPLCTDKAAAQAMLTELVRKAERQQAGLIDPAAEQLVRRIEDHIREFKTHLLAKARSDKHVSETIRLITTITQACHCRILADLQSAGSRLEEYLANRREAGFSFRTINADLVAVRTFCRWLIGKKRMRDDPTSGLIRLNVDQDRRRERRPLTEEESRRLIECTYKSHVVFRHLPGQDRAMLYLLAQRTGLRRKELRSLTPRSFDLTSDQPTVRVGAAHSKRRKNDVLPLTRDLVEALRGYLKDRDPAQPLWPGAWWRRAAEMLRADLANAGIDPRAGDRGVFDFHGQRTTFITDLARAGIPPATAQKLARHSDINLTMNTYTRLQPEDLAGAIERLPALRPGQQQPQEPPTSTVETDRRDPQLQQVMAAWKSLPEQVRQQIMALIAATHRQG